MNLETTQGEHWLCFRIMVITSLCPSDMEHLSPLGLHFYQLREAVDYKANIGMLNVKLCSTNLILNHPAPNSEPSPFVHVFVLCCR